SMSPRTATGPRTQLLTLRVHLTSVFVTVFAGSARKTETVRMLGISARSGVRRPGTVRSEPRVNCPPDCPGRRPLDALAAWPGVGSQPRSVGPQPPAAAARALTCLLSAVVTHSGRT